MFCVRRITVQMMLYEQCVRKKLRSLFEYLDTDKDGKITQQCLLHGLARLHRHNSSISGSSGASRGSNNGDGDSRSGSGSGSTSNRDKSCTSSGEDSTEEGLDWP